MAIALVNQAVGSGTSSANQAITASATIGNFIVLLYARSGGLATGAVTGITDTGGNTWVSIPCRGAASGVTNTRIEFWYCQVAASPGTITITSSTAQTNSWNISEWSGVHATTPIDVSSPDNSATTSSTTCTTPSITSTIANDLIIGAAHHGQTTAPLNTAGFTALTDFDDAAVGTGRAAYQLGAATGSYAVTWSPLGVAKAAGVLTVAIQPAGGADATATPSVVAVTTTIPTPTILGSNHPSVVAATAAVATPTIKTGETVTAAVVSASVAISTPTISAPGPSGSGGQICVTPIKGTVMRLVRIGVDGVSLGTLTIVMNSFTQVQMTPTYEEGTDFFERSADGVIIVNGKTPPIMTRLQLSVDLCAVDPDAAPLMLSARELTTNAPISGVGFAISEGISTAHYSLEVWQQIAGVKACNAAGVQQWIYNAWPHCYNTRVNNYDIGNQRSVLSFTCDTTSWLDVNGPWTAYLPIGALGQARMNDHWLWNVTTVVPPLAHCGAL